MEQQDWRCLAMAYMDDELEPSEQRDFEAFLAVHPEIAAEVQALQAVRHVTRQGRPPAPPQGYWDELPRGVWSRINRRLGWLVYLLGLVILAIYSAYAFLTCAANPWLKTGVAALAVGLGLLLYSVLLQRIRERKNDRYTSEVFR